MLAAKWSRSVPKFKGLMTMPKLPSNFNWENSLSHLRLLGQFVKPNSVEEILKTLT